MKIRLLLVTLLLVEMAVLYDQRFGLPDPLSPVWTSMRQADPGEPTVLFVVLDTVRADRTQLCGHDRPNTPYLSSLVSRGGTVSCHTYAPGSWTMPSHASFFTGVTVPEHGVHFVEPTDDDVQVFDGTGFYTRPLDGELPTLAEHFQSEGYQTVSVSANPLISDETGLARGFGLVDVVNKPGRKVVRAILSHLRWTLDRERPLFLFVNLGDAHEPWEPVPSGLDWVPPREAYGWGGPWSPFGLHDMFPSWYPRTDQFDRLVRREMPEEEKQAWMAHIADLYDYGIYLADDAVRELVEGLEAHGWARNGLRVVVTSDHGEHLGEHDLGDHGRFVHEPVVRIPVVVWDSEGSPAIREPMAGTDVHALVRDGRQPQDPGEVVTYAFGDVMWDKAYKRGGEHSVGFIRQQDKLLQRGDAVSRIDLARDPLGLTPEAVVAGEQALPDAFETAVKAMKGANLDGGDVDADLAERLKQIGYVD
jgi:arylsulfatase A-like enzyme